MIWSFLWAVLLIYLGRFGLISLPWSEILDSSRPSYYSSIWTTFLTSFWPNYFNFLSDWKDLFIYYDYFFNNLNLIALFERSFSLHFNLTNSISWVIARLYLFMYLCFLIYLFLIWIWYYSALNSKNLFDKIFSKLVFCFCFPNCFWGLRLDDL